MNNERLYFSSDYMEGAHENIIKKLVETNLYHTVGYGLDEYSSSAKERIRKACKCENAEVELLVGGTQANSTVIDAVLRTYQGVVAAHTGHIAGHEAGAVEAFGHKVLTIPGKLGKIDAAGIKSYLKDFYNDDNHDHMVNPGMVYISMPTEYGTLYTLKELTAISEVCREYEIPLFLDGARLAYALASEENDVTLPDLAKLCDIFYIGGTKCGAFMGEAVVVPNPKLIPHFFTTIKQHGALFAKGRILGIQFDELFKDDLYLNIGKNAVKYAMRIKNALRENGYEIFIDTPTNQVFFVISNKEMKELAKKVEFGFWEKYDEDHTVIRFATSWATKEEDVERLLKVIKR
ncbi:MAG: low specificity L-threonine aldolase [Lachnospiraceae bacterium]|nr:low specificity L-threonine aldolase [Lachnospiraceae bacterium]